MSINRRVRKSGKTVYEVEIYYPSGCKKEYKTFSTLKEAKAHEAACNLAKANRTYVTKNRVTLNQIASTYFLAREVDTKYKTLYGYRSYYKRNIAPLFGTAELMKISRGQIQQAVNMWNKTYAPYTVRGIYSVVRLLFNYAYEDRLIAVNPCSGVHLPPGRSLHEPHTITIAQLLKLAAACGKYETLVLTIGLCGLRWSEAVALTVEDIKTTPGGVKILHIDKAVTETSGVFEVSKGKTKNSRRIIPIPDFLYNKLASNITHKKATDLLFPSETNNYLHARSFTRYTQWTTITQHILGFRFRIHDLRHNYSTFIVMNSLTNVSTLSKILGHANPQITLGLYTHSNDQALTAFTHSINEYITQQTIGLTSEQST